jgi:O-antigen ligase
MPWADWIYRYKLPIFYSAGAIALAALIAALNLDVPLAGALSFGMLLILIILLDFRILFYILLLVLPLSDEIHLTDNISMHVPTEPLTIILLGSGILFSLLNPRVLRGRFWKHPLTIGIFIHVLWVGISSISSTYPLVSVKYLLAKIWFLASYFFLAAYFVRSLKDYKKIFWFLFLPTLGAMIYILIRHASTGFLFDAVSSMVRPFFRNHVDYGVWITAIFPLILLARSWYRKDTLMRLLLNISLAISLVAIYFSYTRGAWVALLCMPLFYAVMKIRAVKPALIASAAGILLFIGIIFHNNRYLSFAPDFNTTIYHEEFADHMAATFQMQDMSTVERFYRWIAAVKMFRERPVTGFGPGNFVNNYKTYTVSAYETYISDNEEGSSVHNYFLTMLTEQGIPGLVIFVVLIVMILIYFESVYHRQYPPEDKNYIMAIGCCFLALVINNFFSDLLEADKLGPLFFLCVALLVNQDLRTRQAVEVKPARPSNFQL